MFDDDLDGWAKTQRVTELILYRPLTGSLLRLSVDDIEKLFGILTLYRWSTQIDEGAFPGWEVRIIDSEGLDTGK